MFCGKKPNALKNKVDVTAELLHADIKKLPRNIVAAVDAPLQIGGKRPYMSSATAAALAGYESSPATQRYCEV